MTTTEPTDSEMLDAYAVDGSETAFGQLVRRHLALVYSAALRQLGGDCAAAEDVAQLVFAALARDADRLRKRGSLAGWLHTTTRYQAINVRRSDERRLLRETTALAMNPTDDTAAWEEMSPILDTALHELPETDREAVLLRFFEKLSLGEVGSRLGVGEDAARKRVDRALDKLRGLLAKRGVTSATAAALAALLIDRASASPPVQLAAEVTGAALKAAATAVGGGLLAWVLGWPAKVVLMAGIAAIVASVAIQHRGSDSTRLASVPTPSADIAAATRLPGSSVSGGDQKGAAASAEEDTAGQLKLLLYLVDAATDKPVTGGKIEFRGWEGGKFNDKIYRSDSNGYARVYYPIAITDLEVTTRIDGLADTRLKWTPKNGEIIPPDYTLRLLKPASIGGIVGDANGVSLAGAVVTIGTEDDPKNLSRPESHEFGQMELHTDTNGRWRVARIAPEYVGKLILRAAASGFLPSKEIKVRFEPGTAAQLSERSYQVNLRSGRTVRGFVRDSAGRPVHQALVVAEGEWIETESAADGSFRLSGCPVASFDIVASMSGSGTARRAVETNQSELVLNLSDPVPLRIRITDPERHPVGEAHVRLGREEIRPFSYSSDSRLVPKPFPPKLRAALLALESHWQEPGLLVWSNVPALALPVIVQAPGYLEQRWPGMEPRIEPYLIVLDPNLRIRGEVRDAATGLLVPEFEMTLGRARDGSLFNERSPLFFADENLTTAHVGGRFDRTIDGLFGNSRAKEGYFVEINAPGFSPVISRLIESDERDAVLQIKLAKQGQRVIKVLRPDGTPAAGAEVVSLSFDKQAMLGRDGFDPRASLVPLVRTDSQGRIVVNKSDGIYGYAAASPEGFVEVATAGLADSATVTLRPWGRIEGVLIEDGRPLPSRRVELRSPNLSSMASFGFRLSSSVHVTTTDEAGRFVIPQAPPGPWNLLATVTKGSGVPQRIDVVPGETVEVVLGDKGTIVSATPVFPGGLRTGMVVSGYLQAADAIPPKGTPVVVWMRDPKHRAVFAGAWQMSGTFEGGRLLFRDVPPGTYALRVFAQQEGGKPDGPVPQIPEGIPAEVREQISKTFRMQTVLKAEKVVKVPDPAPPEGIDLGEIRLEAVEPVTP
jgi:RNA polymerase sigma factor (sigma-70 family)